MMASKDVEGVGIPQIGGGGVSPLLHREGSPPALHIQGPPPPDQPAQRGRRRDQGGGRVEMGGIEPPYTDAPHAALVGGSPVIPVGSLRSHPQGHAVGREGKRHSPSLF